MGKARSLHAPHLGSSLAACRSPLVGIISGVDPPHGLVGKRVAPMSDRRPARGCNITIKTPIFFLTKKKKKRIQVPIIFNNVVLEGISITIQEDMHWP